MRLILMMFLMTITTTVFANNNLFQKFDNQYNMGYSFTQSTLQSTNGTAVQTAQSNADYLTLDVERLFDIGIWMDVNAALALSSITNQPANTIGGDSPPQPLTQNPYLGGVSSKVGYGFVFANQTLQVIPYALISRNTNTAYSTVVANQLSNIANDYFYGLGGGGRLEYRLNDLLLFYADQAGSYNWDQSGPLNGIMPQNNMQLTTTLGAKMNVAENLQLGLNTFYNNFQAMAAVPADSFTDNGATIYKMQSGFGGQLTIGLTY